MHHTPVRLADWCFQGVVGFYDARDLTSCSGTCSWTPRAGTLGPLTGTASIGSDGWVMDPRMSSSSNTGIAGSQAYTSMVGFKLSDGLSSANRMLVQIGGVNGCRTQLVSASVHSAGLASLRFSGCGSDDSDISISAADQIASSHVWATIHEGGTIARSYWNGAYFNHTTSSTWNTANSPLYVGRRFSGAADMIFPGGVRFVLLLNRALSHSELAQVARWSWETHGVGLDLMNFSPGAWTGVSQGQVYWTPPAHMQPLSSRTVRFMIDVSSVNASYRSIVKFGSTDSDYAGDRMPAIYIIPGQKLLYFSATVWPISDNVAGLTCPTELVGPSFITVVYTRTSLSVFVNSVKQTNPGCSSMISRIADSDSTRVARVIAYAGHAQGGFTLRSLQLLDYAMPDVEAQAPVIISVTPHVLLASHVSLTVMGSPFAAGTACSALFIDGSVSATCTAISAVEIVVTLTSSAPAARPSMLAAVLHNGRTFRAPVNCISPYFVTVAHRPFSAASAPHGLGFCLPRP